MSDTVSQLPLLLKDPLVGTRLGEYEVLEPIGEGGMGVVYRALHPLIKKRVAIKVLKPGAATDATHVKRLIAEAEAVNAVGHRNIVDIFGLGQLEDGRPYIVMEYLEGEPLDVYLRRSARLPLHEVLSLLLEISSPLAAAHAKGVIHRDLKPSNIFRCTGDDGSHYLKLLDFGLAKRAMGHDGSSAQTSQHVVAGTPDYMAPEQARAMAVSPRTDLYAFGVMAFEMLTGELPFTGQTPIDVMMAHVGHPVPSVSSLAPAVPEELARLVQVLMSKDPAMRPSSMGDVRAELKVIVSRLSPTGTYQQLVVGPDRASTSNETPVVRLSPTVRDLTSADAASGGDLPAPPRRRWVVGGLVAVGSVIVGVAALALKPSPPEPSPPPALVELVPVPVPVPVVKDPPVDDVVKERPVDPVAPVVESPAVQRVNKTGLTKKAPTAAQLEARVDRLRSEYARLNPGRPDGAVESLLGNYKLQSYGAETVEKRLQLEANLNEFEKQVLKPLRGRP